MFRTSLAAASLITVMAAPAIASSISFDTLATYVSVPGTTLPASATASGVTATDVVRGFGLTENTGSTFNSRGWTINGDADNAILNGDFLTFGFAFDMGLDLTSLDLGYDRSGTGPMSIAIDLFVIDTFGFGSNLLDFFVDDDVAVNGETANLDLTALDNVSSLIVTLSGYNASMNVGTFDFENRIDGHAIELRGVASPVAAVPLPAGLPLLVGALGLLGWTRRRA